MSGGLANRMGMGLGTGMMGQAMRGAEMMGQGMRTGGNAGAMVAFGMQNQMSRGRPRNNGGNANGFNAPGRPHPTPAQFTQTAMQFDRDEDQQLNRDELQQVASAVISELRSMQWRQSGTRRRSTPDTQQMQEAFVNRAMKFDRDNDGTLNSSETSRMARALIRSLS